jgi:2-polyprenyl-3-methyl-5-hydroxy-6-metoxy-1,4-benzoquinol methylase
MEREEINKRQQEFYDLKSKNIPTRIWSYFRNGTLNKIKKEIGIEEDVYQLHRKWFGDLSHKKVLDLGCYKGNRLSNYLARQSKSYLGIDLSETGIDFSKKRIKDLPNARAEVYDFLSEDFKETGFDLIYAYGVLHHFKNSSELISKLNEKLLAGGHIISHDPLQTSIPIKFIRNLYRPFQSDKDWEWPFSKETYYEFEKSFELIDRRAVFGKTKWLPFLFFLTEEKKIKRGKRWHKVDWEKSRISDQYMFKCMHLSMNLKKIE